MDSDVRKLFDKAKALIDSKRFGLILTRLFEEIEQSEEKEEEFFFGHTFSRSSYSRFEKAVKKKNLDDKEDFHKYLYSLIKERGISQAKLAMLSEINETNINKYIKGTRRPNDVETVFRIALSLQLSEKETELLLRKNSMGFKESEMDAVIIEAISQKVFDIHKIESVIRNLTKGKRSLYSEKERRELGDRDEDWDIDIVD
ncbi:helix-turn-helix transcriptional regulator [Bacillus sp. A301a_S52]|nr:helix-turn-helix transcriptional regulator [Bacillus sp. A301a_S52]